MLNHGIIWKKSSCKVSFFSEMIDHWCHCCVFLPLSESDKSFHFMMLKSLTFSAKHLHFQIRSRPQYQIIYPQFARPKLQLRVSGSQGFKWKKHLYSHQVIISSGLVVHWYIFKKRVPYSYRTAVTLCENPGCQNSSEAVQNPTRWAPDPVLNLVITP